MVALPHVAVEPRNWWGLLWISLFTVAGGKVLVTSLVGEVTTAITVANSYKLQHNPTTGTTKDLCAATDIGTTDTPVGSLLGFQGLTGDSIL